MTVVAVVYHSVGGRTRALAEAVARGARGAREARDADAVVTHMIAVEDAARRQDVLAGADAIIFGCPTYMGSTSAQFKAFMDATGAVWALQGWRDKLAGAFTHSAAPSGDKLGTLTQLAIFAAQHGMVWVGLGLPPTYAAAEDAHDDLNRLGSHLGAMAQSRPGGGVLPAGDLRTAEHLGRRVAEAALRWGKVPSTGTTERHPTTRSWAFPPEDRAPLAQGIERTNLRELAARPSRFEHHLMVCATVDDVQLEIATASEPLYFSHINISDEYAIALPTGDELVDRFPLRTFLSDPMSGADVGRYNHRIGDLVLHPEGLLHWPGRLRPPYEPFDFPSGMRRCGLSLVYCASKPTPATSSVLPRTSDRDDDVKAYVSPPPRMVVASIRGEAGVVARVGRTTLTLVELPDAIAPAHGGWVLVLEADARGAHVACDLIRIPAGATLDATGIVRALVLASDAAAPDAVPPVWRGALPAPFPAFEEAEPGTLPVRDLGIGFDEVSASVARVTIGPRTAEVPRYWLARMLHRVALHGVRVGYAETYGGFFTDDRGADLEIGLRGTAGENAASVHIPREGALALLERLYRAVAPAGYMERLS